MNLYDFFESDIIPMPIANDPNKDYAIFGDGKPVVKFQDKREALSTFNELSKKFPEVKFEIRPVAKLTEAGVAQNTARALAQELYADIKDLIAIRQAGASTGAGNPHNVESLADNIRELYHELENLGYEFDAASPGYIRPLTVDVDTTPQARLREMRCVECGGAAFSDLVLSEKQDACYYKVKSRYKVWPSAYASGALVQCRKKGAANWGNKSEGVAEGSANGYYYLQGGIERSKKFASKEEASAHIDEFFQFARVPRVTLRYKELGKPSVVVGEYNLNEGVAEGVNNDFEQAHHREVEKYITAHGTPGEYRHKYDAMGRAHNSYLTYPGRTVTINTQQYGDRFGHNVFTKKEGVAEASPEATFNALKGLKSWQVVIMNNYYRGKYPDYSGRYYYVLATSPEEAEQVVLNNADAILQELLAMKSVNGRKILPRNSAIRITADRIGEIRDGTQAGRMTTAGFKRMFSPQGPVMVKLANGAIADVQGQEQGVAEGEDIDARIANLKDAIRFETPRSIPGEHPEEQYIRHAKKIADYKAELKKLVAQKKQGVAEGWKEKVGAGLTAAVMATGAGGVVLNPARPIGPKGQTVANPYPNKAANTKSTEDDAWSKIEKRKAAEKKGVAEGSDELYGLRVGDTVKAVINGKRVQGDVIDIFPETQQVELLLRGANAGRTITVDVQDTEKM